MRPLLFLNVCSCSYFCSPVLVKHRQLVTPQCVLHQWWKSVYFKVLTSEGQCDKKWSETAILSPNDKASLIVITMFATWVWIYSHINLSVFQNAARRRAYLHILKQPIAGDMMRGLQTGNIMNCARIISETEPVTHVQMKMSPCEQKVKQSIQSFSPWYVSTRLCCSLGLQNPCKGKK